MIQQNKKVNKSDEIFIMIKKTIIVEAEKSIITSKKSMQNIRPV